MAIISISRGTLSGGEALAKCLAEKLGIPAISQEVLQDAAGRFGISQTLLLQQLEKTRGLIPGPSPERGLYLAAIQVALAERACQGPFVYYGHAGHLLMKGVPQVLKVRVIAPLNRRAQKMAEAQKVSLEEARKTIEKMDEGRIKWTRFLYDVDWRDPALYDLVINLEAITLESACEIIFCALNQVEFQESSASRTVLENFLLASQVKAKLATNDLTKGLVLAVAAEDGVVTITGRFETGGIFPGGRHSISQAISAVTQEVPGAKRVLIGVEGIPVVLE
jgi:cytidylate kinase